jgi:hypothetical protein
MVLFETPDKFIKESQSFCCKPDIEGEDLEIVASYGHLPFTIGEDCRWLRSRSTQPGVDIGELQRHGVPTKFVSDQPTAVHAYCLALQIWEGTESNYPLSDRLWMSIDLDRCVGSEPLWKIATWRHKYRKRPCPSLQDHHR